MEVALKTIELYWNRYVIVPVQKETHMPNKQMICPYCTKTIIFPEEETPRYCPHCGKHLEDNVITFANGEISAPPSNVNICTDQGEHVLTGWLPDGFTALASVEQCPDDPDSPLTIYAKAINKQGKEFLWRSHKGYYIDRLHDKENPFQSFDEYLDDTARTILQSNTIQLLKRVQPYEEARANLQKILNQKKQSLESLSDGTYNVYVVQGQYAEDGGKLYESNEDGQSKYLLLQITMLATEYGSYSPILAHGSQNIANIIHAFQSMISNSSYHTQRQEPSKPTIDTNPNTPIGMHSTQGLSKATLEWHLFGFSSFISNTLPTLEEIIEFYRFINSLKITQSVQQSIYEIQENLVNDRMHSK